MEGGLLVDSLQTSYREWPCEIAQCNKMLLLESFVLFFLGYPAYVFSLLAAFCSGLRSLLVGV